jgi:hypothetical protein
MGAGQLDSSSLPSPHDVGRSSHPFDTLARRSEGTSRYRDLSSFPAISLLILEPLCGSTTSRSRPCGTS